MALPTHCDPDYESCPVCGADSRGWGHYWCDHPAVGDPAWKPRAELTHLPWTPHGPTSEASYTDMINMVFDEYMGHVPPREGEADQFIRDALNADVDDYMPAVPSPDEGEE